MIPYINTENRKTFVTDYCENVENKFKEMGVCGYIYIICNKIYHL